LKMREREREIERQTDRHIDDCTLYNV